MTLELDGAFAALVTPVDEQGRPSLDVFKDLIHFLLGHGVHGLCVGGATSEYVHFDLVDRKRLIETAAREVAGRVPVLSAVGASTTARLLELARHSAEVGCTALLIPMPYFFRYEQRDLETFCRHVCSSVSLPCLLYDLPSFTNGLEIDTLQRLLLTAQNVAGVKDSSGQSQFLSRLAIAREQSDFTLLVGDDALVYSALSTGWNGVVSGTACVCPELVTGLYSDFRNGDREKARQKQALLDEWIAESDKIPFPWAIRVALGIRGFPTGPLPLPLAPFRKLAVSQFRDWFVSWLEEHPEIFRKSDF